MARLETEDLAGRVAELESVVARLEAALTARDVEIAAKDKALTAQKDRIAELEKLLEESHRAGKRQAAPFSKGEAKPAPETPAARRAAPMAVTVIAWHRSGRPTGNSTRRCRRAAPIVGKRGP